MSGETTKSFELLQSVRDLVNRMLALRDTELEKTAARQEQNNEILNKVVEQFKQRGLIVGMHVWFAEPGINGKYEPDPTGRNNGTTSPDIGKC